ncbi:M23 family metallopeptidase [Rossellomorea vietnamensis]|uniref:M23 family metallopeptidase n=1 Tax=Rossellomorea vietnamensis TaxID=218284 RepID=A0A5D4MIU5_9BACI|nr:peptidoglycan DD-metalloendopeptidase family protein [Rossellomorea vietnamensis]TYS00906.1 M23 family metallopeptidase [Rossellomorea vietnamensis]
MGNRADEIRKRIAKRKRMSSSTSTPSRGMLLPTDEERYGGERFSSYEGGPSEGTHPLFSKELFILKILGTSVLVLCTAILFQNQVPGFDKARSYVQQTMTKEFQFAAVASWYEDQFGKPLALLPEGKESSQTATETAEYALPASGKVVENFKSNGQGIMVETGKGSTVEAMKGGLVTFAGKKDDLGQTVIIQHDDKSESWYGNLNTIEVTQYAQVKSGDPVGTVTDEEDTATGEFYFAIKKEDAFIDPIQVITFE